MTTVSALLPSEIIVGHVYEAKRPAPAGRLFDPLMNDRSVLWISTLRTQVQYDSPTVANGRRQPIVTMEAFIKWAKRDITAIMPKGEWRSAT